jgi:hypothetical protein
MIYYRKYGTLESTTRDKLPLRYCRQANLVPSAVFIKIPCIAGITKYVAKDSITK